MLKTLYDQARVFTLSMAHSVCCNTQVTTCDLTTHATSTDSVRPMASPRHTFGAATALGRVYAIGHGRLGDEANTVEFFDPGMFQSKHSIHSMRPHS